MTGLTWALIHSPLVGPASLEPLAAVLRGRGRPAIVPSLLGGESGWRDGVERVRAALAGEQRVALVGHSAAGSLLPAIGDALNAEVVGYAFVDAPVPPSRGTAPFVPPELRSHLEALATDGVLPPWSAWFGDGVMEAVVPDEAQRRALEREMPRLPLAYFAEEVPVPEGWDAVRCGYVLLSAGQYGAMAAPRRARGDGQR